MGNKQKGFTIIEVILFVAISGLLTSMLMVGVSMSINRQQYRDSVQSYAGFCEMSIQRWSMLRMSDLRALVQLRALMVELKLYAANLIV